MELRGSCTCVSGGDQKALNLFVGSLGRPEGNVGYLGRCMKLLVCVFSCCSISDLKIITFLLALMEYHCSDDRAVASRIFERGLDYFGDEIDYVLRYLSFLISINDENSKCFRSC